MKKRWLWVGLGLVLILSGIGIGRFWLVGDRKSENLTETGKTLGVEKEEACLKIKAPDGKSYCFDYFSAEPEKVVLIANFEEGLKGVELKAKNNCRLMTNGGFYDKNFQPLGLLIIDQKQISPWRESDLFNGLFSINDFDTPRITREIPADLLKLAVQSGPLLYENGAKVLIRSSRDFSRRVVVAVSGENKPFFLVFYDETNFLDGPTLEELPDLINKINQDYSLGIADALNLDGGTASLFFSGRINLNEAAKVGSVFCIR